MQDSFFRLPVMRAPWILIATALFLAAPGIERAHAQYGPKQDLEQDEAAPSPPADDAPSSEGGDAPAEVEPPRSSAPGAPQTSAPNPPPNRPVQRTERPRGAPRVDPPRAIVEPPIPSPEALMARSSRTASRATVPVSLAPGIVRIVSRREMTRNGWRSVAEVLANTPGFYVTSDGSLTSVGVRGATGGIQTGTRLIKVMINGTPVDFRPEHRAFIGPEYVPFEAIERIEIVHGPLSSLYGPGALAATVNVITREVPNGAGVSVSGAAMGQNKNRAGYGGSGVAMYSGENARFLLAVTAHRIDRSRLRVEKTFAAQDPSLPRYAPFFADSSDDDLATPAGAYLEIAVPSTSAGTLTLQGGLQQLDANAEFRQNSVLTHQSRESLNNAWVNLRYENRWSNAFASELDLGYSRGEPTRNDRLFVTGSPAQTYTRNFAYQALTSSALLSLTPSPRFSARLGLEANLELQDILFYTVTFAAAQGMREAGERTDVIPSGVNKDETVSNRAAYLLVTGQPIPSFRALSLTGVVRLDGTAYGDTDLPTMISARAFAVAGWLPWLATKVGVSRGFLSPSAVLMFAQSGFGLSNNLIGNRAPTSGAPALEPERVDSIEAEISIGFWKAALLELAVFRHKFENRIEFAQTGLDFVAKNTGDQTVLGGEATLRTTFGPVNPFAACALVDPKEDTLVAYPRFVGTFGIDVALFDRPSLFFDGRVRHVSSRAATGPHRTLNGLRDYSLPSYQVIDLSLSLSELALLGDHTNTEFVASADNVTDERHSEPGFAGFDLPALGRTAFFEVRQSF